MSWAILAGSLGAVLVLAVIARALKLGASPRIDDSETAARLARDAHAGFRPIEIALDSEGRAALVLGEDGAIVLIRPHGAQFAARVFRAPPAVTCESGRLIIASGERMFGDVTLDLGEAEAARWHGRLRSADG